VVSKILVGVAIAVGAAVAIAPPAGAEPGVFNDLSCSCLETVSNGGSSAEDQFNRGILAGLAGGPVVETQQ
jgi:hypothetical protein